MCSTHYWQSKKSYTSVCISWWANRPCNLYEARSPSSSPGHILKERVDFSIFMVTGDLQCTSNTHSSNHVNTYISPRRKKKLKLKLKWKWKWNERPIKTSASMWLLAFYLCSSCLQRGQQEVIRSQWSTHLRWKTWVHGSCLNSSLSLYLARQIQHSCQSHHKRGGEIISPLMNLNRITSFWLSIY